MDIVSPLDFPAEATDWTSWLIVALMIGAFLWAWIEVSKEEKQGK